MILVWFEETATSNLCSKLEQDLHSARNHGSHDEHAFTDYRPADVIYLRDEVDDNDDDDNDEDNGTDDITIQESG
jgi:hypothetical protein